MVAETNQKPARGQIRAGYDEGMRRRFVVRKGDNVVLDLPLLLVVIGAILAPWVAVAGGILAVVNGFELKMVVPERSESPTDALAPTDPDPTTGSGPSDDANERQSSG
jgi:hypothetical protein